MFDLTGWRHHSSCPVLEPSPALSVRYYIRGSESESWEGKRSKIWWAYPAPCPASSPGEPARCSDQALQSFVGRWIHRKPNTKEVIKEASLSPCLAPHSWVASQETLPPAPYPAPSSEVASQVLRSADKLIDQRSISNTMPGPPLLGCQPG